MKLIILHGSGVAADAAHAAHGAQGSAVAGCKVSHGRHRLWRTRHRPVGPALLAQHSGKVLLA